MHRHGFSIGLQPRPPLRPPACAGRHVVIWADSARRARIAMAGQRAPRRAAWARESAAPAVSRRHRIDSPAGRPAAQRRHGGPSRHAPPPFAPAPRRADEGWHQGLVRKKPLLVVHAPAAKRGIQYSPESCKPGIARFRRAMTAGSASGGRAVPRPRKSRHARNAAGLLRGDARPGARRGIGLDRGWHASDTVPASIHSIATEPAPGRPISHRFLARARGCPAADSRHGARISRFGDLARHASNRRVGQVPARQGPRDWTAGGRRGVATDPRRPTHVERIDFSKQKFSAGSRARMRFRARSPPRRLHDGEPRWVRKPVPRRGQGRRESAAGPLGVGGQRGATRASGLEDCGGATRSERARPCSDTKRAQSGSAQPQARGPPPG